MKWDEFSAQCKSYEKQELTQYQKGQPLFLRLDGRAFHTYTRGLKRPYDARLSECMKETTKTLVADLHAKIGYTQSDEITLLLWADPQFESSCLPFDGRYQKLISVAAGLASAKFAVLAQDLIPEKRTFIPHFDCRVWSVPSFTEAIEVFVWRQQDAFKNSITMAAQTVYSHKELLNKNSTTKIHMLAEKGIDWKLYPTFFKYGSFFKRITYRTFLSEEERMKISEKHRPKPDTRIIRSHIIEVIPPSPLTWDFLRGTPML